jgi:hypothetical protein
MKQQINEFKRMQLIAGLITESEYRQSLSEEMELPKVGDKFSYEDDEIQITGVDDKFVDAKSTKKNKTYNFGLRSWKEGFKGSKLNEMEVEDIKVGGSYTASMPTSNDGKERIDVKVKVVGLDKSLGDGHFVIEPLEDKRYTNPASKQENEFSKGKQYGIEAKYLK